MKALQKHCTEVNDASIIVMVVGGSESVGFSHGFGGHKLGGIYEAPGINYFSVIPWYVPEAAHFFLFWYLLGRSETKDTEVCTRYAKYHQRHKKRNKQEP